MPHRIKTARIAFLVAAGLWFATAALFLFIFIAAAVYLGWGTERAGLVGSALTGLGGIALSVLCAGAGAGALAIAAGIARGRAWSQFVGMAAAVVLCFAVPVGTVLGIIALTGLASPEARDWFQRPVKAAPSTPRIIPPV